MGLAVHLELLASPLLLTPLPALLMARTNLGEQLNNLYGQRASLSQTLQKNSIRSFRVRRARKGRERDLRESFAYVLFLLSLLHVYPLSMSVFLNFTVVKKNDT